MSLSTDPNALKKVLNDLSSNQSLADNLRLLKIGDMLRSMRTSLRAKAALGTGVNPYTAAAAQSLALPEGAKAHQITRAYARAGSGTLGELTVDGLGLTAAAGHIAVSANGDIVVAAADAWTSLDVTYNPEIGDVIERQIDVVPGTGIGALSTTDVDIKRGVILLMEAESLAGTLVSKMHIAAPATAAPATGLAQLDLPKLNVRFAVADAVTTARVKLLVVSKVDVDALLEAASNSIG